MGIPCAMRESGQRDHVAVMLQWDTYNSPRKLCNEVLASWLAVARKRRLRRSVWRYFQSTSIAQSRSIIKCRNYKSYAWISTITTRVALLEAIVCVCSRKRSYNVAPADKTRTGSRPGIRINSPAQAYSMGPFCFSSASY